MKNLKNSKVIKMLVLVLSLVFFTSTIVATSLSKYVTEENAQYTDEEKNIFEHLDYTVNAVFVVKNQDELFSAINQGYTYVQLDKDIENPLIVTQKAETLNSDLILDLNGIEIQRNGYEPILNIKPGVRLTVVDTSEEQTGGLYNPVGSVFNITGGTLTVVTGTFESGPRYSEYYTYNNGVLRNQDDTKRTIVESSPQIVNFYRKNSTGDDFQIDNTVQLAPIIKSYPQKTGDIEYNHGNLYFDEIVNQTVVPNTDLIIQPDTYCYYRTSEDTVADASDVSMADWYYSYFVKPEDFTYKGATVDNPNDYIEITIYGYENVIKQASTKENPDEYHAAIQMTSGTLDVQDGGFFQYFGVNKTACVNAQGGQIKVKKGEFSSRVPNAYSYASHEVIIKEVDEIAFNETYFNNFKWIDNSTNYLSGTIYNGRLAKQGEAYCILNGGSATVTVGTGNLYSSNNNIISMGGGELSITGGEFTKRLTNGLNLPAVDDNAGKAKLSAINMQNGTLGVANAECLVLGEGTTAILMQSGNLTVNQTNFNVQGDSSYGIYSLIEDRIDGVIPFSVKNSSFTLTGEKATGIYSERGTVRVSADASATISTSGAGGKGIYVLNGGSVDSNNYSYTLNGINSIGILADNGATGIDVTNGSMSIKGAGTYGIKSSISGNDKFMVKNLPISMTDGTEQTGIYSENGKVTVSADTSATISTSGEGGKGIYVLNGGSVDSNNYSYSLSGDNSIGIDAESGATGINVTNGSMQIKGNKSFGINSFITGTDTFIVKDLPITMTNGTQQTGIFAQNGRVNVDATSSKLISIEDAQGKGIHVGSGGSVVSKNYSYKLSGDSSYGIYSIAGLVDISGGDITLVSNDQCYGVYAFSATEQIQINIEGAEISVGYNGANKTTNTVASVGVFLATTNNNSKITLTETDIRCYEVGVLIDGGSLDVKSTSPSPNEILTQKASSIIVKGGNVLFDKDCNYNITSSNTRVITTTDENVLKDYDVNLYDITIPKLSGSNIIFDDYQNTDGIYVEGGNFTINGAVSITHNGLANNYDLNTLYYTQTITSYAVRVTGGKVAIVPTYDTQNVEITANIGGGVFCGKSDTKNGELELGKKGAANTTVHVETLGNANSSRLYHPTTSGGYIGQNWEIPVNLTGGNAVELNGGSITLNCGTYSAKFGNGILAKIPYKYVNSASDYSYPTITVNNGKFTGGMDFANSHDTQDTAASGFSGPGSSYGIKIIGGADVQLFDGIYSGEAGGVMITGITDYENYTGNWAKLRIYGGIYGCDSDTNLANAATDGIMIFDKSLIAVGAYGSENSDKAISNNLTVIAVLCPISENKLPGKENVPPQVKCYYAKYLYGQSVCWSQSGAVEIYNRYNNSNMYFTDHSFTNIGLGGDRATYPNHSDIRYFSVTDYTTEAQSYWNASTATN